MDISFVPLAEAQLQHVIFLAHRIWPVAYANLLTPEQIENMLLKIYTRENLTAEMANGHQFWLAYDGIKPVGYASAYKDEDIIWLKKLYVDPALQGQKIGTRLMHKAVSALLPAQELRLLANPNNHPAHAYYMHMGFQKIGEVPVQMGDWHFNDYLFSMALSK